MHQTLVDLAFGFGVALQAHNLPWAFIGILAGNFIGVLPGMGPLSAIAVLLPLTFSMHEVPALMMLAGIFYGSMYGGVISAILLNLPSHPPHAVTCIDGYPMTLNGEGARALGVAMISSFFAASCGIVIMIVASPWIASVALDFGAPQVFSIMLLGLLAGGTMGRSSPIKGAVMTLVGILIGLVGGDVNTGTLRFTFGFESLDGGVSLIALALGLYGIADFLHGVNRVVERSGVIRLRLLDLLPSWADVRRMLAPMLRGTLVGSVFGVMPGTGPTVTSFVAYACEQKFSKYRSRLGHGILEGVASPEAASHSKIQIDFIPTLNLGIPGDPVMALLLGALMLHNITPGPDLIVKHAELFWGLIASFWIGNVLLMILNIPLIGLWIRLLSIPYRFMFPCAMFFIAVGVYSVNNSFFEVGEVLVFGIVGFIFLLLDFPLAPVLLGYVLGPMVEENFRRSLIISRGSLGVFFESPISAAFMGACIVLIVLQLGFFIRRLVVKKAALRPRSFQES